MLPVSTGIAKKTTTVTGGGIDVDEPERSTVLEGGGALLHMDVKW